MFKERRLSTRIKVALFSGTFLFASFVGGSLARADEDHLNTELKVKVSLPTFGLVETEKGLHFFDPDTNSVLKDSFKVFQGKTYYFNSEGNAISGLWEDPTDRSLLYFDEEDHSQLKKSWKSLGKDTYYFDERGKALRGLQTEIKGGEVYYFYSDYRQAKDYLYHRGEDIYFFCPDGRGATGLQVDPKTNKHYYFDELTHKAVKNTAKEIGQDSYYFTADGSALTGSYQDQEGNLYFYDTKTAKMLKNEWQVHEHSTYYFGADGKAVKGFLDIPETNSRYYFDPVTSQQVKNTEIQVGDYLYPIDEEGLVGPGELVAYIWPTDKVDITSYFGYRWHPIFGGYRFHDGIDLADGYGSNIYAVSKGTVITTSYNSGLGYYVQIRHDDGSQTTYAHLSSFNTSEGSRVSQGQVIGYMGSTGNSTGSHLHFEVLNANGQLVDPLSVLP